MTTADFTFRRAASSLLAGLAGALLLLLPTLSTANNAGSNAVNKTANDSATIDNPKVDPTAVLEEVKSWARNHYQSRFPNASTTMAVKGPVTGLSNRRCDKPPLFEAPRYLNRSGNALISIRCEFPEAWRTYVPIAVNVSQEVLVAVGPIARNTSISSSNTARRLVNLDSFRDQYVTSLDSVGGKVALRTFRDGQVIRTDLLTDPTLIERGDRVLISARAGGTVVKMMGTALASGKQGEQIRVKNSSSSRIVVAEVKGAGRVEVYL